MIMKGSLRDSAISPSQPHNPSSKSPASADEANNRQLTALVGIWVPSVNGADGRRGSAASVSVAELDDAEGGQPDKEELDADGGEQDAE